MKDCLISRRRFIQTVPLTASAFAAGSLAAEKNSRIVEVHRPGVINENNQPDLTGTQEMLDKGMREFTGEKSRRDQWARFVSKEDVVGLKVNCLGGPRLSTKKELLQAIIRGLLDAGVEENNIIIWDRRSDHLRFLDYETNLGKTGVRVYASDHPEIGYADEVTRYEAGSSHLSKILTEQITAIINVPILKDHAFSGTTMSLKNISHGIVDNPHRCHANNCDPYIAQINALPIVRKKHRLVVLDALQGCCNRGPIYSPGGMVNYESLYFATDCLAMDTIGTERINAARKAKGLPSVDEGRASTKYLATAERLGLGNRDKARIDHQQIAG